MIKILSKTMRLKSHYLWNAVVYNRNDATINLRAKREDLIFKRHLKWKANKSRKAVSAHTRACSTTLRLHILLLHCHGNSIWHTTTPYPTAWQTLTPTHTSHVSDSAAAAVGKQGKIPQVARLSPVSLPGMPSFAITSQRLSKLDKWRGE